MMRSFFTACILLISHVVTCQISFNTLKAADRAFDNFSYLEAADLYGEALKKAEDSLYILERLSDSFKHLNDPTSGEEVLATLMDQSGVKPEYMYQYAQTLLSNGKHESANIWYGKYAIAADQDQRIPEKLDAIKDRHNFFSDSSRFEISRLSQNSPGLDFSPAFYHGGIVFVSSRVHDKKKWVQSDFNWDASEFLDFFFIKRDTSDAEKVSTGLNTEFHEGPLSFYQKETKVILTRNNYEEGKLGKDDEGVTRLKLYFREWNEKGNQWTVEVPFDHNSDHYSVGHPTMNEEGDELIFTSDLPDGFGQTDLYYSRLVDGKWSSPTNLGPKVNSSGKEMFPFWVKETLFFASDGKGGLGGLDVFQAEIDQNLKIGLVKNVGAPVNSRRDDFGLISNATFSEGYFTSARIDSLKDDIYTFNREAIIVTGEIYDLATDTPLEGADVFLIDSNGSSEVYMRSDDDGVFQFPDSPNSKWVTTAGMFDYELVEEKEIDMSTITESKRIRLYLKPLLAGSENFPIRVNDFLTEELRLTNLGPNGSLDTLDFILKNAIGPIYYDFDKYSLRDESKSELDKLHQFMEDNPLLIIQLAGHTDARSSDNYNLALSQKRAIAAYDYLIEKGTDPSLLLASAIGEKQLINDCDDEDDCEEEAHQSNRRTEFIIMGSN